MIIEFNKKRNFYDDLTHELYNSDITNTIYNNFIPIKLLDEYYILTSAKNLEGYLVDYRNGINVKLYIMDNSDIECIELILNNVVIFGSKCLTDTNCYIDTINNLLLIKFNSSKLNYIQIDNNLNCENNLRFDTEKIKLKYIWTDENFNTHTLDKFSKIINTWNDKYINLPPIPYMIDIIERNNSESETETETESIIQTQIYPITGSGVYDSNNNFIGLTSYVNPEQIIITPLVCIKKMQDYLRRICDN